MTKPQLLDTDGLVAEGPGENVFVVKRGVIQASAITSAPDSIARRTLHTLAHEAGHEIVASRVTRGEFYIADEVFFTGTTAEITPDVEGGRRRVARGAPGR